MFVYHMWSDFGGDPNHDVDTGILNAILPLLERGSCKNFRNQLPRRRFMVLEADGAVFYVVSEMEFERSCWQILFCHWAHISIRAGLRYNSSSFLLHPCGSTATSVFIPAGFPRIPRGPRLSHSPAVRSLVASNYCLNGYAIFHTSLPNAVVIFYTVSRGNFGQLWFRQARTNSD